MFSEIIRDLMRSQIVCDFVGVLIGRMHPKFRTTKTPIRLAQVEHLDSLPVTNICHEIVDWLKWVVTV